MLSIHQLMRDTQSGESKHP